MMRCQPQETTMSRIGILLASPIGALLAILSGAATSACSSPDPVAGVVKQYATNLDQNYKDVVPKLEALKVAVDAFVAGPSADGFTAAQQAWLAARPPYSESEYSRFYGGPIDAAQGGMNEWPIDESFIDYTVGNPSGGIINDPVGYPQLTAPVLASADERGGIENLSTGYHAIEFLLWGQRPDQTEGPGTRPYTDYVDGGTAAHQDRRRTYLKAATQLLLDQMRGLEAEWNLADPGSFGGLFVADKPLKSLTKIYRGLSQMAISELYYERLNDPFISKDQKDEESCFSESTLTDLVSNMLGVEDAYLGRYGQSMGPSVSDLVRKKAPALDAQVREQIAAVRAALAAIPPPFDHAALSAAGTPGNDAVVATVQAFKPLQGLFDQAATALGIVNNL
jgi:putative iron-regulated protein